jgi:two-component system sensor histidine kinase PilS (NtrC family)
MWFALANWLHPQDPSEDIYPKLKWLMLMRVVFTTFLFGSTLLLQFQTDDPRIKPWFTILYLLIATIFFLSLFYALISRRIKDLPLFGYFQISIDVFIVTLIVYITGGFFSFFSFLYLVVIIYASMILYLRGGIVFSLMCGLLYAIVILLQYTDILPVIGVEEGLTLTDYGFAHIIYKILIILAACFAVAILSGILTEQTRKSQKELHALEGHVKRVEKMAYMGEMAAGLAHEIKNPLASLVGCIQMLKEDLRYDSDYERLMDIILRETDRLSTLVNDFLYFARPPAGKPELINLKDAIEDITAMLEKDATQGKKYHLRKELVPDTWIVMDPTHLRQVLWNLLLNAVQAIEDDGHVEVKVHEIKHKMVNIQISDNGCGIPNDVVQTIFDPFYTTKPEGTGLGLSIVHRILEAYSSRLDVMTLPHSGTTVSFSLQKTRPESTST